MTGRFKIGLIVGAAVALALVVVTVLSGRSASRWARDRDSALATAAVAAESLASERALRYTDSLQLVDLRARGSRIESEKRASDDRRRVLAGEVAALRREFTALADSSTPSDSVFVLMQLVHGLDAQNDELERRVVIADSSAAEWQRTARVLSEGRDRAIAQVEQMASVTAQLRSSLERADPPCRGCPSRKASYLAGLVSAGAASVALWWLTK